MMFLWWKADVTERNLVAYLESEMEHESNDSCGQDDDYCED